jgi:hypothetical protein
MPDPKKKKPEVSTTPNKQNAGLGDTQQLSDALARKVAKGSITMEAAQKQQRAADKKAMSIKSIQTTTGKGSMKLRDSRLSKPRKPKFKRNKRGNIESS